MKSWKSFKSVIQNCLQEIFPKSTHLYNQTEYYAPNLCWKLCALQHVVLNQIYRILYDEMEVLAVGSYEDGGALPISDVVRKEKEIL